jgi:hydrogenase maturation protease
MDEINRKVVLGLGNLLNKDEGLGIHALNRLEAESRLPAEFELVDGGTLGMNLLPLVEECSHLLILDATDAGRVPGEIIELEGKSIPLLSWAKLSEHQVGFQEVLALANFRERFPPHLYLIGIQPDDLNQGIELSQVVENALPQLIIRAGEIIAGWQQNDDI